MSRSIAPRGEIVYERMSTPSPFDDALALMRDLRVRCDWDAAQSHESLRPYLIEEAHEVDEAIRSGDDRLLREELGDLLLQVLFHAVLAEERAGFEAGDVPRALVTKMKGRHPHLYGEGVKEPWERMKAKRRTSIVDGLPAATATIAARPSASGASRRCRLRLAINARSARQSRRGARRGQRIDTRPCTGHGAEWCAGGRSGT